MGSEINLFIPIEVKSREFYSKVLLARCAAEHGFRVFIGRKSEINRLALSMPNGIYHGLSTSHNTATFYEKLKKCGHCISVNDEEGLVTFSDEMYLDLKVSRATLAFVDRVFVWGAEHYRTLADGRSEFVDTLRISGNPRFDLLKPQFRGIYTEEIQDILNCHPKFVLICMSFASCNHYIRDIDYMRSLIEKQVLRSPESVAIYKRFQAGKTLAWHEFLRAIPLLARAYPDTHFIIRPHPSESDLPYKDVQSKHSNVFIDQRFSIHPWVLAAKAVVHHYCTSSVESFAAGTPGFALRPHPDQLVEKETPYRCSRHCASGEELVELLDSVLKSENPDGHSILPRSLDYSKIVHNMGSSVAAEVIAGELVKLSRHKSVNVSIKHRFRRYKDRIASIIPKVSNFKSPDQYYISHKFDHITPIEVKQSIARLTTTDVSSYRISSFAPRVVTVLYE